MLGDAHATVYLEIHKFCTLQVEFFFVWLFLHATIKDVAQCIYWTPIKPNNIIHMNCDLTFFDYFPKCIIPDEELDDGLNDPLIHFSVYTFQVRCLKHGIIPNVPTLCKICE